MRLTGESDGIRRQAIEQLRDLPNLEATLRQELTGPKRFLAYDVVGALMLQSLMPDLLKISETEESGAAYLAINSLVTTGNRSRIARLYQQRLSRQHRSKLSIVSQVIMLDTLARMGAELPISQITELIESPVYEIKSAALYYLRHRILKTAEPSDLLLAPLEVALRASPYQLRIQALFLIKELPGPWRSRAQGLLALCDSEPNAEAKAVCQSLKEKAS